MERCLHLAQAHLPLADDHLHFAEVRLHLVERGLHLAQAHLHLAQACLDLARSCLQLAGTPLHPARPTCKPETGISAFFAEFDCRNSSTCRGSLDSKAIRNPPQNRLRTIL